MSDDYKREDIALKLREVAAEVGAVVHKVRVIPGKQLPQTRMSEWRLETD
jgi:hypothetical protein